MKYPVKIVGSTAALASLIIVFNAAASDAGASAGGGAGGAEHGGWVDGYGRGHGGATAGDSAHYDSATVDRARMAPWRGYDIDCPDNDPHARH